jgi:hypothetical protein
MGFSYNDLKSRATTYGYDTSSAVITTNAVRLFRFVGTGGSELGEFNIRDSEAHASGTVVAAVNAPITDTRVLDFGPTGTRLATGLSVEVAGLGANFCVTYMEE